MRPFAAFSRFSEPQAVIFLLGWLRILTTGLLVTFCAIAEWAGMQILQPLLDWKRIGLTVAMVAGLCLATLWFRHREAGRNVLLVMLLLDIVAWSLLVDASGGAINPAISYLLVLLSIAALSLTGVQAFLLAIITVGLYGWIMLSQSPHSGHHGHMMMGWHLWGMWVLFVLNTAIMLVVIAVLSRALREKDHAIAAYREETVRNEQLVSMGTLAANIAHELGTPLSTIAIVLDDSEFEEKPLVEQQLERCRKALQQLKTTTRQLNSSKVINSSELLQLWVHEALLLQPGARIHHDDQLQENIYVSPLLEQAILALLNNAIEAASTQVTVVVLRQSEKILVDIRHDGKPVSDELLKLLGHQVVESSKQGLGLGYYLANASIERLGGQLHISNQGDGVLTRISFPRAMLEQGAYE